MPPNDIFKAPKSPLMNYMNYKNKLFTLVEVMAVMTIIVIMLSIGVSGYRSITSQTSLQIEGMDLVSEIKKSIDSSLRSNTPVVFNVQMGKTLSEKSYMFGGKSSLRLAFDFDSRNTDGEWAPHLGAGTSKLEVNDDYEDVKEFCYSSDLGMCGDLRGTNSYFELVDETYFSNDVFGVYIECKIKLEPLAQSGGTGVLAYLGNNNALQVNAGGYLISKMNNQNYPSSDHVKVDTGEWLQVGTMFVKVSNRFYILQFVDGHLVSNSSVGLNTFSMRSTGLADLPKFGEGFNGLIDDIKVYDVLQGDIFNADPKAGFLVTANGNLNSNTSIVIDGEGRLVPLEANNAHGDKWLSDFIGLTASSVYGIPARRNSNGSLVWANINRTYTVDGLTVNRWDTSGSKLSLPESGYLALHHKNIATTGTSWAKYFELVKYKDYDGSSMIVTHRALGGTNQMNNGGGNDARNYIIRYVYPLVANKFGGVSR